MNISSYNHLINKPQDINEGQMLALEKVLDEFPFFQSARALRLKGLYMQNSYKYNFALKVVVAHTTDRTILFDFITSESFIAIQKKIYDKKMAELFEIKVTDSEVLLQETKTEPIINLLEQSILTSIKEATPTPEENSKKDEKDLETEIPINFSKNETHSFQQWLEISRLQPIDREDEKQYKKNSTPFLSKNHTTVENPILDENKKKKAEIIDKFIETSPRISPLKLGGIMFTPSLEINKEDNSYLMTETLARIYLEQKKYLKAIQAYEILILKYPEKSSFFANRIKEIKIIQQTNH